MPSSSLPSGHRTLRAEDTRTTRPSTADSWPNTTRGGTTILRNTRTLSCRRYGGVGLGRGGTRKWRHHCEQSPVALVTACSALPSRPGQFQHFFFFFFNTVVLLLKFLQKSDQQDALEILWTFIVARVPNNQTGIRVFRRTFSRARHFLCTRSSDVSAEVFVTVNIYVTPSHKRPAQVLFSHVLPLQCSHSVCFFSQR